MIVLIDSHLAWDISAKGQTSQSTMGFRVDDADSKKLGFPILEGFNTQNGLFFPDFLEQREQVRKQQEIVIFWESSVEKLDSLLRFVAENASPNLPIRLHVFLQHPQTVQAETEHLLNSISDRHWPESDENIPLVSSLFVFTTLDEWGHSVDPGSASHAGAHLAHYLLFSDKGAKILGELGVNNDKHKETTIILLGLRSWAPDSRELYERATLALPFAFEALSNPSENSDKDPGVNLDALLNPRLNAVAHDEKGASWAEQIDSISRLNPFDTDPLPGVEERLPDLDDSHSVSFARYSDLWMQKPFEEFGAQKLAKLLPSLRTAIESERKKILELGQKVRLRKNKLLSDLETGLCQGLVASRSPRQILDTIKKLDLQIQPQELGACPPLHSPPASDLVENLRQATKESIETQRNALVETTWGVRFRRFLLQLALPVGGIVTTVLAIIAWQVPTFGSWLLSAITETFLGMSSTPQLYYYLSGLAAAIVAIVLMLRHIAKRRYALAHGAMTAVRDTIASELNVIEQQLRKTIERMVDLERRSLVNLFRGFTSPTISILRQIVGAFTKQGDSQEGKRIYNNLPENEQKNVSEQVKQIFEDAIKDFQNGGAAEEIRFRYENALLRLGRTLLEAARKSDSGYLSKEIKDEINKEGPLIWAQLETSQMSELCRVLLSRSELGMEKLFDDTTDSRYDKQSVIQIDNSLDISPLLIKTRPNVSRKYLLALVHAIEHSNNVTHAT